MFSKLWRGLVNLVYPNICLLCRKELNSNPWLLCSDCSSQIEKNTPPFCQKCGRQLYEQETEQRFCLFCQKNQFYFERAFSACIYEGRVKELIHLFKYKGKIALARPLAKILVDFIKQYEMPFEGLDLVMPIPLHSARLREREYNQAELLAREISVELDIELNNQSLIRKKNTMPQIKLTDKKRWQNVKGAFRIKKEENIWQKRILLIDDLITTGATCSEAAYVLKDNGAKEVYVLTLACA